MDVEEINKRVELNIYAMKQLEPASHRYKELFNETEKLFEAAEA